MSHWYAPLDPECPEVEKYSSTLFDDPMTLYSGCGGEIWAAFEKKHRAKCKRCQEFGAANIEARY